MLYNIFQRHFICGHLYLWTTFTYIAHHHIPTLETTSHSYQVRADVAKEGVTYVLNNEGHFWKEKK